jgi:fructuronate reductase
LGELGIEVSDDVARYEKMKLRLFNGAHSSTAYFSQLSNLEYVYQAMQIPAWQGFTKELQKELSCSFTPPSGVDLAIYSDLARSRIANSAVAHRSAQIAMDGSAKLPQRLFKAINALAQENKPRDRVAFALALWIKFLASDLPIVDPLATDLRERARRFEPVASVMQTPGLRDPVLESEWMLIDAYLQQLKRYAPIEIVGNF